MKRALIILLFFLTPSAFAQSGTVSQYVQFSASKIQDSAGNLMQSGTITFTPQTSSGASIFPTATGGGRIVPSKVQWTIASGTVSTSFGQLQLVDVTQSFPVNFCYNVSIHDNVWGNTYTVDPCMQPAWNAAWCTYSPTSTPTTTCNFDNYVSPAVPGVQTVAGPPGVNWRGAWSSSNTYALNDGVSFNGSSYISLIAGNTSTPGGISWSLLASQGGIGNTGAQGVPGAMGLTGPGGTAGVGTGGFGLTAAQALNRTTTGLTMITMGTSIDAGALESNPLANTLAARTDLTNAGNYTAWVAQLPTMSSLKGRLNAVYNYPVPGYSLAEMNTLYTNPSSEYGMPEPHTVAAAAGATGTCLLFQGAPANDIPTSSAGLTASETALANMWAQEKADGCYVVSFTVMERVTCTSSLTVDGCAEEPSTTKLYREQYDSWIRAQEGTLYDRLIDLDWLMPDTSDPNFTVDGTHPTTVGGNAIADWVNSTLWGANEGKYTPTTNLVNRRFAALQDSNLSLHFAGLISTDVACSTCIVPVGADFVRITAVGGGVNLESLRTAGTSITIDNEIVGGGNVQIYDGTSGSTIEGVTPFSAGNSINLPNPHDRITMFFDSTGDWKVRSRYYAVPATSYTHAYKKYTASGSIAATDDLSDCDGQTLSLTAAAQTGHVIFVINSSTTACSIQAASINGSNANYAVPQYGAVSFMYDGTQWHTSPGIRIVASTIGGAYPIHSVSPGTATNVGTGATAVCATQCNNVDGKVTLTTGTGTLAAGQVAGVGFTTLTPYQVLPNCHVWEEGATALTEHGWSTSTTTSQLSIMVAAPLTASTAYTIGYHCFN